MRSTTMHSKNSLWKNFLKLESASGILMIIATILAMGISNSPLLKFYNLFLETTISISIGNFIISKPLLLWINDGLMAIFFFMVGLELKREFLVGELSNLKKIMLPAIGAIGGMILPALIYTAFNYGDAQAMQGWAIPAATDIAFSLGVLSLLGKRIPASIRIFLSSLAIFDDLGAIIIIAFFYTAQLSFIALMIAMACFAMLLLLNKYNVSAKSIYVTIGIVMWAALLKSGVHATLAGVLLALCIPLRTRDGSSPLKEFEHTIHHFVAFFILPLFAFTNTGINFAQMTWEHVFHNVTVGIAAGLFVGKQFGIFTFCLLAQKLKIAALPTGANWHMLYGTSLLCGIGFTMSLFIGSLAFEATGTNMLFDERIGILVGSLLSGITGYFVLRSTERSIG